MAYGMVNRVRIPGFYYDEEKKRYFKIDKNKFSHTKSVINKERLSSLRTEKKRLSDLKLFSCAARKGNTNIKNFVSLLESRRYGFMSTPTQFVHNVNESAISSINYCSSNSKLLRQYDLCNSTKISFNKSDDSFVVIDKYTGNFYSVNIDPKKNKSWKNVPNYSLKKPNFDLKIISHQRLHCKVLDFSWLDDENVIAFGVSSDFSPISKLILQSKHSNGINNEYIFPYRMFGGVVDSDVRALAFSLQSRLVVAPVEERLFCHSLNNKWEFPCSPYISMDFSKDGNVLYIGSERGKINFLDLKAGKICRFVQHNCETGRDMSTSVTDMYTSCDGFYLLFGSSKQIALLDIRVGKVVLDYAGISRSHKSQPVHVDANEQFVSSVGSDGYTHIWDFKTARKLRNIPPPSPVHLDAPAISFMPKNELPGLMMLHQNNFYAYIS
ncbi:hypothetical protein HELRODRAFT_168163 [Helobdella robusta]|uniref:Uncharacterized protein n=1 Tax=Helobdella robusta TaxID=6412 RepID=T1F091_HELRO|nr:hypothetical protein HELRODRAFT_168163 [Helobdella robusta]ESO09204.1 hypothetical protein HELRODRAFT_168163 [Helobdella robusta]